MRRANGSGSVYKLSGKRHKPWAAKITIGWTDDGKQIYKLIGTFETKKEAREALDIYLMAPKQKSHALTLEQSWEGFEKSFTGSSGTLSNYKSAYNKTGKYQSTLLEDMTLDAFQELCDTEPKTYATASAMKKMLSAVLEYAFAHDGCPASRKALLQYLQLPDRPMKTKAEPFTDDEIQTAIDSECVLAVVLLFTGLRRDELVCLTLDDIDLDQQVIHVRKSKTQAGLRDVPIPDRLVPWMERYIASGAIGHQRQWLVNTMWKPYPVSHHTRHDCRHTYITKLTEAGVDERMIKQLVGHAGGVTNDVYTHYSMEKKLEAVNTVFNSYLPLITEHGTYYESLKA